MTAIEHLIQVTDESLPKTKHQIPENQIAQRGGASDRESCGIAET